MTLLALSLTAWLANRLAVGSFQAIVVVTLVWLACRWPIRLSAAVQATLWWLALLKIVLVFAPLPSIPIPVLPAGTVSTTVPMSLAGTNAAQAAIPPASHPPSDTARGTSLAVVVGLWLAGAGLHAALMLRAFRMTRAIVRRSQPSAGDVEVAGPLAARIGLSSVPDVRASEETVAPQVVGMRRPVVLMPAATTLSSQDRLMALGHEFMHVKRGDLALGWIPAVAERLFFFHPVVRLAAREYLSAREAACDAAVIRALGVSPEDYGRLLIRFGVTRQGLAMSAGGASGSSAALRRRLDMLQHLSGHPRRTAWLAMAFAVVALVPSHLVARTASIASPATTSSTDTDLPRPLTQAPAVTPMQQESVAPRAEPQVPQVPEVPESAAPRQAEPFPAVDELRARLAEIDRLLRDGDVRKAQAQVERDQQKVQQLTEIMRETLLERGRQADQAAEEANRIQREVTTEVERRLELSRKEQEQALEKLLADQPETRQRLLQQRLQELQDRLTMLADMQRQLQIEADRLKQELGDAR